MSFVVTLIVIGTLVLWGAIAAAKLFNVGDSK